MRRKGCISAGQLFTLAFLTRLIMMVTVDSRLAGGGSLLDLCLSAVLYLGLNLLFILPAWLLHRRWPELDVIQIAGYGLGRGSMVVAGLYVAYFLFMNGYFLSFFTLFMENEVNSQIPVWVVGAAVLVVACYGAFLGLEPIARTGGFIFLIVCAGMLFLLVCLNQELRAENFSPLLYDGPQTVIQGTLLFVSRGTFYCILPLLMPRTTGKLRIQYLLWNVGLCLFFIVMLVTVCGALGPMAQLETAPVHTAAALAQSGPFQRLDAIYIGIWMMGLFLILSLDLYLVSVCVSRIWGKAAGRVSILVGAMLLLVASNTILLTAQMQQALFRLEIVLSATLGVGMVLPLVVYGAAKIKQKQGE